MKKYDVVICGGGIAGLWLVNTLSDKGYSVLLLEKEAVGGIQTLGSQGMIHGGQKYLLGGNVATAARIASLPARWDACLDGVGDIDLREVRVLAENQVMWPAGGLLARTALMVAAHRIKARMRKMSCTEYPKVFASDRAFKGSAYVLPEKVLDMRSLVSVLYGRYADRIRKGTIETVDRDGHMTVSGFPIEAQLVISVAGLGNEEMLGLLGIPDHSQRRPLRQIMVKTLPYPLYGHGVELKPSPRVTITSYESVDGGYVWYVGGSVATHSASLTDEEAIAFTKRELKSIFPYIDWSTKEWATWYGERAEARDPHGKLPEGPVIQDYGNVIVAWPTKFTFTPLLSDQIHALMRERNIEPKYAGDTFDLARPPLGTPPWEKASWRS